MVKYTHEIRDPIHAFIHLKKYERAVLDSRPFQRLRNIHQLATTFLVYPGATHKRFEHSLGVMELASRVYDVITDPENVYHDSVRDIIPKHDSDEHRYYRCALRMAALCHDMGHLPFSHAAEAELLPEGSTHEHLTKRLIFGDEMKNVWASMRPPLDPTDVAKLALGKRKLKDVQFSLWESIVSEIIVGDAFGVDRMDYLLRDSLHTGVGYGKFDHYRLIETLRMLPLSDDPESDEPVLGIEEGGLRAAEALMVARYFMFSQVYFHHVRRVYDKHLKDFLLAKFGAHGYPMCIDQHLEIDDNLILTELQIAAGDVRHKGYDAARLIVRREHYKLVYTLNPSDLLVNPAAAAYIATELRGQFPEAAVFHDHVPSKKSGQSFPVRMHDGRLINAVSLSPMMASGLDNPVDYVFINEPFAEKAEKHLGANLRDIIEPREEPTEEDNNDVSASGGNPGEPH